jgi:hypothetical protein
MEAIAMMKPTLAVLLLAAAGASAEGLPTPAPELAQLAPLAGTFACTGQSPQSPFGPAHATEATVKGGPDLNGFWFSVRYEEKKTAANPTPVTAQMYIGYDAAKKQFTSSCLDSFGGICHQQSAGWQGDALVFEGEGLMGGEKMGSRDTFTKKGTTIVHRGEIQVAGKWTLLDEETCTPKK